MQLQFTKTIIIYSVSGNREQTFYLGDDFSLNIIDYSHKFLYHTFNEFTECQNIVF